MTVTLPQSKIGLASRLVNGVLAIKPLANFAKSRARNMMIKRAENIGIRFLKVRQYWTILFYF